MIEAHREHTIYKEAAETLIDLEQLAANFMMWYKAGLASGDAPFIFYSGYVYGDGMIRYPILIIDHMIPYTNAPPLYQLPSNTPTVTQASSTRLRGKPSQWMTG